MIQFHILLMTFVAVGIARWVAGGSFARFAALYMAFGLLVMLTFDANARRCGAGMPVDWKLTWRIPAAAMAWPGVLADYYRETWDQDCKSNAFDAYWEEKMHPSERSI